MLFFLAGGVSAQTATQTLNTTPGLEATSSCVWERLSPAPLARVEAPSVAMGQEMVVFGGFREGLIALSRVDAFDPATDTWRRLADMPAPVTHAGFAFDGRYVWFVGGFLGDHPGAVVSDVWQYDTQTDVWAAGPSLPQPRGSGAAAVHGRSLHFFGGVLADRNTDSGDHWVLDLDALTTWQPAAPLPVPRNHLGAASLGGEIWAIGGQFRHDVAPIDVTWLHAYDPSTDTWREAAALPFPRSHFEPGVFVVEGQIVVAGGRNNVAGQGELADVTSYDPSTDVWQQRTPLPRALLAPAAQTIGGEVIVSGGGYLGVAPTDEVHRHTLDGLPGEGPLRINAGGAYFQDAQGRGFCGDQLYRGGRSYQNPAVTDIVGTQDDSLFLTERSSETGAFDYRVPIVSGVYHVRLHFAEIYWGAPGGGPGGPGRRVFDVTLEGQTVLASYDIFADVGAMTAVVKSFRVDVQDGALDLGFAATVDQPKVSAIEIVRRTASH